MADMIKKQEVIFITKKYNIEDVKFKKKKYNSLMLYERNHRPMSRAATGTEDIE